MHVAAGLIQAGAADVVVAGGAENMSRVPMGSNRDLHGEAFGWMAGRALRAHRPGRSRRAPGRPLAAHARRARRLRGREPSSRRGGRRGRLVPHARSLPVPVTALREKSLEGDAPVFAADETIRPGTQAEKLATLKTSFRPDGRLTAGNSSQISDGAAALLLMSGSAAERLGVKPRARIRAITTVGSDPTLMLTGPIEATRRVLAKAGPDARRHRPVRGQRGLRAGAARLDARARRRRRTGSTSTAARSRSAIRSAPAARAS